MLLQLQNTITKTKKTEKKKKKTKQNVTPVLYENIAFTKGISSIFYWTVAQTYQCNAVVEFLCRRDAEVSKLAPCEGFGSKEQKL